MTKGKGKEQKTTENGEKGQNAGKRGEKRQKTQDKAAPDGGGFGEVWCVRVGTRLAHLVVSLTPPLGSTEKERVQPTTPAGTFLPLSA